jgi:predicted ATPase
MVCQLVGPGGIGKSRLATEAALALHAANRREVVEVALAT